MAISVAGVAGREMPGLKAALNGHRKAWVENGDAVLNLADGANGAKNAAGEPLSENDPRPAYQYQPFRKMVYHAKNGERVVDDEAELALAIDEGYRLTPFPVVRVAHADPGIEKANLQRELKEKDGQISTLADQMKDMQAQMAELLAAANGTAKTKKQA